MTIEVDEGEELRVGLEDIPIRLQLGPCESCGFLRRRDTRAG